MSDHHAGMEYIENRPFEEIKVGDHAELVRTLTARDIDAFAVVSGDVNPAHVDEDWNISQWGEDEEATLRRARRFLDFKAAALALHG